MRYLKGTSALMIFDKQPDKGDKWDRTFWARGYYVADSRKYHGGSNKAIYNLILLQKPCFSENGVRVQKKDVDFKGFADILFSDKAQIHVKSDFLQ